VRRVVEEKCSDYTLNCGQSVAPQTHYYSNMIMIELYVLRRSWFPHVGPWAYGKEKIRAAERNLPDFFGLCPRCQKKFSGETFQNYCQLLYIPSFDHQA
jgi:hypothetical protein